MIARGSAVRRITGRGALVAIACLLVASAGMRFAAGSGAAIAREVGDLRAESSEAAPDGISEEDLELLLATLRRREAEVIRKEEELASRAAELALAEDRLAASLHRLEEAEQRLKATIAVADSAAETDLTQLTSVYENMKPQQAAPLFDRMTPAFAAGFLGRMRPDAAAAIMSGLDPDAAYAISVILAGRNADVPRSTP